MSARNRPLVMMQLRPRKPKGPLSFEEALSKQMDQAIPFVAAVLMVCPKCFEDLQIVDGRKGCPVCDDITVVNQIDLTGEG